jgi:hypothetical protein
MEQRGFIVLVLRGWCSIQNRAQNLPCRDASSSTKLIDRAIAKNLYTHSKSMNIYLDRWPPRFKAALAHLAVTAAIALISAILVFYIWYPSPFEQLSGGAALFLLIVACDMVLGPLLTLVVFDPKKSRNALIRDLAVICSIQLLALLYGLWTMFIARPIFVSFEKDSFRVVHANEVVNRQRPDQWDSTLSYPLTGPKPISLRPFKDQKELFAVSDDEISAGIKLSFRPELWQPYDADRLGIILASKPIAELLARKPNMANQLQVAIKQTQFQVRDLSYLPIVSREKYWTVFLKNDSAEILKYVNLDTYD